MINSNGRIKKRGDVDVDDYLSKLELTLEDYSPQGFC